MLAPKALELVLSIVNSSGFLRIPILQFLYGFFTHMSMKPVACRWCFTLTWEPETWKILEAMAPVSLSYAHISFFKEDVPVLWVTHLSGGT